MRFSDFLFFKQKTAYEMRISDWSSDVCSSDLQDQVFEAGVMARNQEMPGVAAGIADHVDQRRGGGEIDAAVPMRFERVEAGGGLEDVERFGDAHGGRGDDAVDGQLVPFQPLADQFGRSEEHTSELQSLILIS